MCICKLERQTDNSPVVSTPFLFNELNQQEKKRLQQNFQKIKGISIFNLF